MMALWPHAVALASCCALASSLGPASCPASLFAVRVSAARNATGQDNVKAQLVQPEGATWQLDMEAKEQAAGSDGAMQRITTIALFADAEGAGQGESSVSPRQLQEQQRVIAALTASVADLQSQLNATEGEGVREEMEKQKTIAEELKLSVELLLLEKGEVDEMVDRLRAEQEATNAGFRATIAALQQEVRALGSTQTTATLPPPPTPTPTLPPTPAPTPPPTPPPTPAPTTLAARPTLAPEQLRLAAELVRAALKRNVAEVRQLLARRADVHYKDAAGETALLCAARNCHPAIVRALLAAGAPIDGATEQGATPLHWAARQGHLVCVHLLVTAGADMNTQDKLGYTPLHEAARFNRVAVLRKLLQAGARPGIKDVSGNTPYDVATHNGVRAVLRRY